MRTGWNGGALLGADRDTAVGLSRPPSDAFPGSGAVVLVGVAPEQGRAAEPMDVVEGRQAAGVGLCRSSPPTLAGTCA